MAFDFSKGAVFDLRLFEKENAYLAFCAGTWKYTLWLPMTAPEQIDWSQCPLVEVNPRVHSGAPVLRGTRIPVNAIVDNFDYGLNVAEISEQFEVPEDRIRAILAYAKSHRIAHSV